ncbi:MAG: argininosuccinate lyase, partial [Eubacteriales bacterium]|nr:argininosuccinate lyase [Eubacteriales bacterium]
YGSLMGLLTMMKGLPLAYNKDTQEDKEQIFDAVDTVKMCLPVFGRMLATMRVRRDKMLQGAKGGFTNATDVADYLVRKGLPFRDAHGVVGRMVAYCIEKDTVIESLSMEEMKSFSELIAEDIYDAISLETCVNQRKLTGGPAMETMRTIIEKYSQIEQENTGV